MAYAAAVLSELQNGASPLSGLVSQRGSARRSDGHCQRTARTRRARRRRMLHRRNLRDGEGRRRRGRTDQAWKRHENQAILDRHGLPLSVSTHAANHHEVRLVQLCFDFYMIEAKPENLIGDRCPYRKLKQLTDARESVDSPIDERALQIDLVRFDRA